MGVRLGVGLGIGLGVGSISRPLVSININDLGINVLPLLDVKLAILGAALHFLDDIILI